MGFFELMMFAIGLSMDAFAVSVCKGLSMRKAGLREGAICGAWFGGFQAAMPLGGYFLASIFAGSIQKFDYIVAFVLLSFIGANMLKEAFGKECECEDCNADLSVKTMFVMAVATSIDALIVGVSMAMDEVNIWLAVSLIGAVTFLMCALGVKVGNIFGSRYEKKAQAAGGFILLLLGLKALIQGLIENFGAML